MDRVFRGSVLLVFLCGTSSPLDGQQRYALDELLQMGREKSPIVLALQARREAADARRRDAGRFDNPELEYRWGSGTPFSNPDETRTLRGFSVSQIFENPISRHYRMGALRSEVDAAAEDLEEGVLDVEFQIKEHFYRVLFLQELVRLAALNEEALSEVRDLIETRAEMGEVRELEAIRLRVEHLRAVNEHEAAQIELDQFRRHLNTFLGNRLPEDFELEGTLEADPTDPDLDLLMSEVLPGHPLLARADSRRQSAQRSLRVSQLSWLPDPTFSFSADKDLGGNLHRFGVGISFPLWNQGRAASAANRARLRMAEHQAESLRMELEAQLLIHHNHLRLARQTLSLFEEGLMEQAVASMEIAETSYREGELSFMEYLDARRTYHSIQIERQQALYEWNVERAALDRAAGGEKRK